MTELGHRARKLSTNGDENDFSKVLNLKVGQLVKTGIGKGMFLTVDPAVTATAINSTMKTLVSETAGHFDKAKVMQMFDKVEQLFIDGLLLLGEDNND